jgi:uncharacterized protein
MSPSRSCILIFAKPPIPGCVKTRMVPPLSEEEAAKLASACTVDLVARLAGLPVERVLAVPSRVPADAFGGLPHELRVVKQGPGDLGAKLALATSAEFDRGADVVAAVGSDHPDLPLAMMQAALDAAHRGNVGWITTRDGGYACIALPRTMPHLFEGVPWSTGDVAAVTRNNASRQGILLEDAGPWYDLDAPSDVDRFLARPEAARECPATWAMLATLAPAWKKRRKRHG